MKKLDLSRLAVNTKKVEFDFPGLEGFKVTLSYLSRSSLEKLREDSMVQKIDPETGYPYKDLDKDLYIKNYVTRAILGWKGFTYNHLSKLILIDESLVEDMNAEIDFDVDAAVLLVTNSERFDTWVTTTLRKLDNFRG